MCIEIQSIIKMMEGERNECRRGVRIYLSGLVFTWDCMN